MIALGHKGNTPAFLDEADQGAAANDAGRTVQDDSAPQRSQPRLHVVTDPSSDVSADVSVSPTAVAPWASSRLWPLWMVVVIGGFLWQFAEGVVGFLRR
ncbi:MAG: hypothetical protein QOI66_2682 [Myxococcales bacterium]|jgi:hypothetical protein|nr:hypothetical protein [Myxococcales bacterium]